MGYLSLSPVVLVALFAQALAGAPPKGDAAATKEDSEFVEATVANILVTEHPPGHHVVLLRPKKQTALLPIWIGPSEALAISLRLAKRSAPRPLTHDILERMLGLLKATIVKIQIEDLKQEVFLGRIFVKHGDRTLNIDARPSDSIALALGANAPIFVHKKVVERAGLSENDLKNGGKNRGFKPPQKEGSL